MTQHTENPAPDLSALREQLSARPALRAHPQAGPLLDIVTGDTDVSSAGFPYISDRSFQIFREQVPHLYQDGLSILDWLRTLETELEKLDRTAAAAPESAGRAIRVLRSVVLRAGITATPDLWLLRHVLSTHKALGILDRLLSGHMLDPVMVATEDGLDVNQLTHDLHFLHARGYLQRGDGDFAISANPAIARVLQRATVIPDPFRVNMVAELVGFLESAQLDPAKSDFLNSWLSDPGQDPTTGSWVASYTQVEIGYRLLPCVLALRSLDITPELKPGAALAALLPHETPALAALFERAGFTSDGKVTELGARVFERGPGPFGIIGAYHPYVNQLETLLRAGEAAPWVRRAENVAASQDANRKSFAIAHDKLDQFCRQYGYEYTVFIEHALGRGEAIRQRFERDGGARRIYIGADLEDAAIEQAKAQQEAGILPPDMMLIHSADIGHPERVIQFLEDHGLRNEPTVMMVGNGLHEVRNQTNERMTAILREYERAGFLLVFTEESALHDEALIQTAWNTYHAGFRYVHEMSGQGLRPAVERKRSDRWSWKRCAEEGGYVVMDEFSYRSRTIYPYRRPQEKNPSISVTYFCVPRKTAEALGIDTSRIA